MKNMSIREFRESGLLQEMNRQFLHPMGLALAITAQSPDDGSEPILGPVFDFRDDPEGGIFGEQCPVDPDKAATVAGMFDEKRKAREATFGWHVQPVK